MAGLVLIPIVAVAGGIGKRWWTQRHIRAELTEARREMDEGLHGLARKRLIQITEEVPEQPEALYRLGQCEAARGRVEAAVEYWARIPATRPGLRQQGLISPRGSLTSDDSPRPKASSDMLSDAPASTSPPNATCC